MQTAEGAVGVCVCVCKWGWGEGLFVGGTTVGIPAEYGWAHRVTPFLFIFLHKNYRSRTREPGLPSTGGFWERPQHSRYLQPKRARRGPGPGTTRPPRPVRTGSSTSAWLAVGPGTRRASGAHFKGIEKNLFPDLQRTCAACTRSSISESSNSSTISYSREPGEDSHFRGLRGPEGAAY